MKKLVLLMLLIPMVAIAGESVDLPYDVVISEPLTDKAEQISLKVIYREDGNHYAVLTYWILNNDRTEVLAKYSFAVRNLSDDPESITANCISDPPDEGNPWPLCTGAGTCTNDCDESTTDMTDYVGSFWNTLNSRTLTLMNQDLQARHTTQAKP